MSRQPAILLPYDPAEAIGIAEAARRAGKGERTIREWCALHRIGRRIGGRWAVSQPALDMLLEGDAQSNSLPRDGQAGMSGQFKATSGTEGAGSAGPWIVERFNVPSVRKGRPPFWRELPVGTYTRLRHRDRGLVMSDIPHEMLDVTVVEVDRDVIALVAPTYAGDRRLAIVNADAFTYQPPQGQRYAMVWHDIWDGIRTANLEQMAMLRRKFDQIADWQGCWAEDLCMRWAAREAGTPGPYQEWARDQLLLYLTALVQVDEAMAPLLRKYEPIAY